MKRMVLSKAVDILAMKGATYPFLSKIEIASKMSPVRKPTAILQTSAIRMRPVKYLLEEISPLTTQF